MRARQAHITLWVRIFALGGLLCAGLEGCGQGEDLTGLPGAVLRVTTATTGPAPGAYTLAIDGSGSIPIAPLDTLTRSGIAPGEHTVELGGVPGTCAVDSSGFRTVTASEGDTTALDFLVTCVAVPTEPTGALVVTLTTVGVNQDPDGYVLGVDPSESRPVGLNESVRFDDLSAGAHAVRLSGLAANCSTQGENPRSVQIVTNTEVAASFTVRCWPPATGTIAFVHASDFEGSSRVELMDLNGTVLDELFTPGFDEFHDWPSWSPAGGFLAFTAGPDEFGFDNTVFVQDLSAFSAVGLPGCYPTGDRPQWSPNGTRLLCLSENPNRGGALTSVLRDGSGVRSLSPAGVDVVNASFLPDGSVIFTTDQFSGEGAVVYHVSGTGGTPVRLFDLPSDITGAQDLIVVSPDGSRLTYARMPFVTGDVGLYVARLDGTEAHLVSGDLIFGAWSPPAWSPDGTRLAFEGSPLAGPYGIWLVASDGSGLTRLPLPGVPEFESSVAWSPDGTRLVVNVVALDSRGQIVGSTIYVIRSDGSGLQQLTGGGSYDAHPVWGP